MQQEYIASFLGRKVGFVGLGVSNLPILRSFLASGIDCTVRDKKPIGESPENKSLSDAGVRFLCGESYLENIDEDVVFLSPAVRPDLDGLREAAARGVRLTSEMEEFFKYCPCKIIGVTGSDGKTTTTTLIAKLLEAAGHKVHLGGNIGANLLEKLGEIGKEDFAVVELSSFQLFKMTRSPDIAVVTNIAPNHLDWHTDMEEYIAAKEHIFAFQNEKGALILNADDPYAERYASKANGKVRYISGRKAIPDGVWFDEKGIHKDGKLLLPDNDILIVGRHNRYNYSEAILATDGLVTEEAIRSVATGFGGVEHRCELVRVKDGVKFYNSTIDSSPSRTKACLESFKQKVIIICGGYDKHIPLEPLGPLFRDHVKYAVLCGATAEKIETVLTDVGFTDYCRESVFADAVKKAASIAKDGDCVVLSPAAASFDLFKNFAERGNVFKQLVKEL
ncbi:MAG: UDP-N-acetylmuramoyl-L-alanine--D-glutamate ligase [Clostridiales bacterium]|nr:UDP-N-acetylmuramoyl-L-alanine--D-glutamate ligase [Candidatus Coliplasma caballi]